MNRAELQSIEQEVWAPFRPANTGKKIFAEPVKALFYAYFYLASFFRRGPKIAVVGEGHARPNLSWKVFRLAGVTEDPNAALVYVHYKETFGEPVPGAINGLCTDISKSHVNAVFLETFGYALGVDPLTYSGPMVEKSEINALHDGRVVHGPLREAKPGAAYQRLVDCTTPDGDAVELRTCIVGDEIPYVYVKYRPIEKRFLNMNTHVTHCTAEEAYSPEEIGRLLAFCRRIGLDIGELDVLRDNGTGQIFVVDCSKTPHSPGEQYINLKGIRCMERAAAAFRRMIA